MKVTVDNYCKNSLKETLAVVQKWKKEGDTIVTTNGCFDIIHSGHVQYLEEAAALGKRLIVGLNSDESVKRLKGEERPLQKEKDRLKIMASLKMVDLSFVFYEDDPCAFLDQIKPDFHVKGGDYTRDIPEKEIVEQGGGKVVIVSFKEGLSTTSIINNLKD